MSSVVESLRILPPSAVSRRPLRMVERNARVSAKLWAVVLAGFLEPLFYLILSREGFGQLIDSVSYLGREIDYVAFAAPGLMAASAMNGAIADSTFGAYGKLKWQKVYEAVSATPLSATDIAVGEVIWSQIRGALYATAFLVFMLLLGLVQSWWAILSVPAAVLIGFAFASCGLWATTHMRTWQDFTYVTLAVMPMFLFSAVFYPLDILPDGLQLVVGLTPLYQGVALERALVFGDVGWATVGHALYLTVMGLVGLRNAARRFGILLG
ncbi:MAG: ABC transporter permease [Acidimicrobiia bacterium]|nr:ABC transporter permease [Acidimicrobiia bacterium]